MDFEFFNPTEILEEIDMFTLDVTKRIHLSKHHMIPHKYVHFLCQLKIKAKSSRGKFEKQLFFLFVYSKYLSFLETDSKQSTSNTNKNNFVLKLFL